VVKVQSNVFTVGDRPVGTKLMFPYVRGEDGSVTDTLIMSFRTRRVVYSKLSVNKQGHGYRVYTLLPANYLMYEAYRTGKGRASIKISVIDVSPNPLSPFRVKDIWVMYEGVSPVTLLEDLPGNIRVIIEGNRGELPLYEYLETEVPR
jgi:hypothetical protein